MTYGCCTPTHGKSRTVEYKTWKRAKNRCNDVNAPAYKDYGGRGITMCKRWDLFENFLEDMGEKPNSELTLERVDNERGYSPDNCIWATRTVQQSNRRNVRLLDFFGETMTITAAAKKYDVVFQTLYWRIVRGGWSTEKAVTM